MRRAVPPLIRKATVQGGRPGRLRNARSPVSRRRSPVERVVSDGARLMWRAAGVAALVLGLIGVVLPILPTIPFILVAAFCFSKGSHTMEAWLLDHPRFGQSIRDWRERGAIPMRAKRLSSLMMILTLSACVALALPHWVLLVQLAGMAVALLFIWTRPTA